MNIDRLRAISRNVSQEQELTNLQDELDSFNSNRLVLISQIKEKLKNIFEKCGSTDEEKFKNAQVAFPLIVELAAREGREDANVFELGNPNSEKFVEWLIDGGWNPKINEQFITINWGAADNQPS